jgi:hypothetical protein
MKAINAMNHRDRSPVRKKLTKVISLKKTGYTVTKVNIPYAPVKDSDDKVWSGDTLQAFRIKCLQIAVV